MSSLDMIIPHQEYKTDVLVVGGGFAGVFAALHAKEQGADVIMVDKGRIGRSGLTPFARGFATFDKESQDLDEFMTAVCKNGHSLANQDYIRVFAEHTAACGAKLEEWGVTDTAKFGTALRVQVLKKGIRTIERTMLTDLIKQDGRIVGAVGFPMEEDKAIVIKANAVVLCTGDGAFKPGGFPCCANTSDGESMAYRAGAGITGKEFVDCHPTSVTDPSGYYIHSRGDWTGIDDFHIECPAFTMPHGPNIDMAIEYHAKGGPVKMGPPPGPPPGADPSDLPPGPKGGPRYKDPRITIGASAGLSGHKTAGVAPVDGRGYSGVPGLYAAGDALGSMMCGAFYSIGGGSSSGSASQGLVAGIAAAEYAKELQSTEVSQETIDKIVGKIFSPREREEGYDPSWVTQMLQNTVIPYYALYIKSEKRLLAALENIEHYRDHYLPNLVATDTHELRLAHETCNMVLNAEMKIRASLMRTETRGTHYREDYPQSDDSQWLKWIIISRGNHGHMQLATKDVPEAWVV